MKFSDDNPLLSAAEEIGAAAKEALLQRDEARRERDTAVKRVAELEEELTDTRMRAGKLGDELTTLHGKVADLEATNEDLRGRVFDVDLRDAIHALLKQELTAGELRRALGELVR